MADALKYEVETTLNTESWNEE